MTVTIKAEKAAKPAATKRRQKWWQLLGKDRFAAVAAVILGIVVLTAVLGPWLIGDRATRQDLRASVQAPSFDHGFYGLLGTDVLGRSVLARLVEAAGTTLSVAVPAVLCSLVVGSALGLWAGYHGGWRESLAMRLADVILSFPSLLLAVVVLYVFSPSAANIVAILAFARIPIYLRTSRAESAELRTRLFVDAARTFGTRSWPTIYRHLLPIVLPTLLTVATLDGVDLTIGRGETVGLVGESGCGKSTLARVLLMLARPDAGTVRFGGVDPFTLRGKELLAWRRRVQMVFQDPYASLNERMTAAELIGEPWRTHGAPADKAARVRELLELVGLRAGDADRHPGEFSGGQRQRIGIARALALNPDLIVCDEPVSALDLSVQAQVLNLLADLQRELGVSYLFISHDLSVVRHVADRVSVMYLGKVVEEGPTEQVFDRPVHPYTAALMSAAPRLSPDDGEKILLRGEVPSPLDPPSGCRFRTRCWKATDECASPPPVVTREGGQTGLCHHPC